jgi:hypothetical protein
MRCKTCKQDFPRARAGRTPIYCSAACRQKAYRSRLVSSPQLIRLLKSDVDQKARESEALRVLRQLGYAVHLKRIGPVRKRPSPTVRLIK